MYLSCKSIQWTVLGEGKLLGRSCVRNSDNAFEDESTVTTPTLQGVLLRDRALVAARGALLVDALDRQDEQLRRMLEENDRLREMAMLISALSK